MSNGERVQDVLARAGVQPSELRNKAKFKQALAVLAGMHIDCKHAVHARLEKMHRGDVPATDMAVAA